jgi:hypothetical protein
MWITDTPGYFDTNQNSGFKKRQAFFGAKERTTSPMVFPLEPVTLCGRLMTDFATSSVPLPPGSSLQFDFTRSEPNFYMMSFDNNPDYIVRPVNFKICISGCDHTFSAEDSKISTSHPLFYYV